MRTCGPLSAYVCMYVRLCVSFCYVSELCVCVPGVQVTLGWEVTISRSTPTPPPTGVTSAASSCGALFVKDASARVSSRGREGVLEGVLVSVEGGEERWGACWLQ